MISKAGKEYFTPEEEISAKENANALEYAMSSGYKLVQKGHYYTMADHDSLVFSPDGRFHWNSRGIKNGNAITFIKEYEGRSYKDAILTLAGSNGYRPNPTARQKVDSLPKEKSPLDIPEHAQNNKVIFAYLIKTRGISPALVSRLVSERKIYQDKKFNNLVMVGHDDKGKPQYISKRSTDPKADVQFKGDATGSDKSYPFVIEGEKSSTSVCVCESPIEAMSLHTLCELTDSPYLATNIISIGGVSTNALDRYLKEHPNIKNIIVCTNNDPDKIHTDKVTGKTFVTNGGKAARTAIQEKYGESHTVAFNLPHLNDWSDVLVSLRKNPLFKDNTIQHEAKQKSLTVER